MLRSIVGTAAVLLLTPVLATAQQGVEVGFDAGLSFRIDDQSLITAGTVLPASQNVPLLMPGAIRIAFPVGVRASIEPRVGFSLAKPEGEDALTALNLGLGIPINLKDPRRGPYVRPFATFASLSAGGQSADQFGAGIGLGHRAAVADRLVIRLEVFYEHGFESEEFVGADNIGLLIGLSMFTK